ncbi:T-complex protein 1 subunit beta [Tanacetum coccineum]
MNFLGITSSEQSVSLYLHPLYGDEVTEEKGELARMASFVGAMAIADLVKTTLGPKGMGKILQSTEYEFHRKSLKTISLSQLIGLWRNDSSLSMFRDFNPNKRSLNGDHETLSFGENADYRKFWLLLKPESCGKWVKNAGIKFGLLEILILIFDLNVIRSKCDIIDVIDSHHGEQPPALNQNLSDSTQ